LKYKKVFVYLHSNKPKNNIMSWGVYVKADVYVSRVGIQEVDSKLEDNKEMMTIFEKEIAMLVASTPKDVASDEVKKEGDIISDLRLRIDEIFEAYRDCVRQNTLLEIVKENINDAQEG
jgi:hypothetical protein